MMPSGKELKHHHKREEVKLQPVCYFLLHINTSAVDDSDFLRCPICFLAGSREKWRQ